MLRRKNRSQTDDSIEHFVLLESKNYSSRIEFGLGSGSDFLGFDQLAGSSNFDATYTFKPEDHGNLGSYPLYHTSYEVFSMVKKFVDPNFSVSR